MVSVQRVSASTASQPSSSSIDSRPALRNAAREALYGVRDTQATPVKPPNQPTWKQSSFFSEGGPGRSVDWGVLAAPSFDAKGNRPFYLTKTEEQAGNAVSYFGPFTTNRLGNLVSPSSPTTFVKDGKIDVEALKGFFLKTYLRGGSDLFADPVKVSSSSAQALSKELFYDSFTHFQKTKVEELSRSPSDAFGRYEALVKDRAGDYREQLAFVARTLRDSGAVKDAKLVRLTGTNDFGPGSGVESSTSHALIVVDKSGRAFALKDGTF